MLFHALSQAIRCACGDGSLAYPGSGPAQNGDLGTALPSKCAGKWGAAVVAESLSSPGAGHDQPSQGPSARAPGERGEMGDPARDRRGERGNSDRWSVRTPRLALQWVSSVWRPQRTDTRLP